MSARTDLAFLRRRARRDVTHDAPNAAASQDLDLSASVTVATPPPIGAFLRRRTRRTAPAPEPEQPPQPQDPGLDLDDPAPAQPAPRAGANPLDLGSSGAPEPPASGTSSADLGNLLDLDAPTAADRPAVSGSGRHRRLERHDLDLPIITAGERRRMDGADSLVHLTRAQSAFGGLEVTPAVPAGSGLVLGVAYQARGIQGVVLPAIAPMGPDPMSPIFRTSGGGVIVNLRRVTALDRFLIYAVLTGQDKKMPGGTIVVGTYGGARLELPLGTQPTYGAQALLTAYVVEGRIVLRAEHDPFSGTLHQVCDAYGFSELTWRDPSTPLV